MNNSPTLTLFCGLPGSGKTTLAKQLERDDVGVRLCTDDWQQALGVEHSDKDFHTVLQAALYDHALKLLRHGVDVILEDGLWKKIERERKLQDLQSVNVKTTLHYFDISYDELWRRLQQRNGDHPFGAVEVPKDELDRCWQIFQRPDETELTRFDRVVVYDDYS